MEFKQVSVSKRRIRLSDLSIGDIFIYNGCTFMVIPTDEMDLEWRSDFASVNLASGDTTFFGQDIEIIKLNKEIVVEYEVADLQEWI